MTEQQLLLLIFEIFGTVFLVALVIWLSDLCFRLERGPVSLQRFGHFFCGTFRRAMTIYGLFNVVAVIFMIFLLLWPYISGWYENTETTWIEELLILILTPTLVLPLFFRETYRSLARRFQREAFENHENVREQLKVSAINEVVETAFRQSTPGGTVFKELIYHLFEKHEKMHPGKTRDVYTKAFEQLLVRDDECGEAFREIYEEWHASHLSMRNA
ncbi:MAG: hypothetical protein K9W43_14270 [Candidatus Thorarchaeota archaeon]|nr:hypothetical protein [Candidatus Thorarchaeota archaeon]